MAEFSTPSWDVDTSANIICDNFSRKHITRCKKTSREKSNKFVVKDASKNSTSSRILPIGEAMKREKQKKRNKSLTDSKLSGPTRETSFSPTKQFDKIQQNSHVKVATKNKQFVGIKSSKNLNDEKVNYTSQTCFRSLNGGSDAVKNKSARRKKLTKGMKSSCTIQSINDKMDEKETESFTKAVSKRNKRNVAKSKDSFNSNTSMKCEKSSPQFHLKKKSENKPSYAWHSSKKMHTVKCVSDTSENMTSAQHELKRTIHQTADMSGESGNVIKKRKIQKELIRSVEPGDSQRQYNFQNSPKFQSLETSSDNKTKKQKRKRKRKGGFLQDVKNTREISSKTTTVCQKNDQDNHTHTSHKESKLSNNIRRKEESLSLRERMLNQLKSSRFRFINEQLYTSDSKNSENVFKKDPNLFYTYHEGFKQQVEQWPLNPVEKIIKSIKRKSDHLVIADFGCGDALLAKSVHNKVYSFDLVALSDEVTVCDIAHTPLEDASIDIAVFCLSLMGTNLGNYLVEANRVLKDEGLLTIAEVASRFKSVEIFIKSLKSYGFIIVNKDFSHNLFYFMNFKKMFVPKNKLPPVSLKPCWYKKR